MADNRYSTSTLSSCDCGPSDSSTITNEYDQGVGRTMYGLFRSAGLKIEVLADRLATKRPKRLNDGLFQEILPFTALKSPPLATTLEPHPVTIPLKLDEPIEPPPPVMPLDPPPLVLPLGTDEPSELPPLVMALKPDKPFKPSLLISPLKLGEHLKPPRLPMLPAPDNPFVYSEYLNDEVNLGRKIYSECMQARKAAASHDYYPWNLEHFHSNLEKTRKLMLSAINNRIVEFKDVDVFSVVIDAVTGG
ncbi:hypothetical protein DL96DRAFT_1557319 [Flagelloscypha sp. PMI_526]|nr:hypothetical protein DL96DRAFT_1557319 [Flagelloscypha sp. PMI_526]